MLNIHYKSNQNILIMMLFDRIAADNDSMFDRAAGKIFANFLVTCKVCKLVNMTYIYLLH